MNLMIWSFWSSILVYGSKDLRKCRKFSYFQLKEASTILVGSLKVIYCQITQHKNNENMKPIKITKVCGQLKWNNFIYRQKIYIHRYIDIYRWMCEYVNYFVLIYHIQWNLLGGQPREHKKVSVGEMYPEKRNSPN